MTSYTDIENIRQLDTLCKSLGFRYDRDHLTYDPHRICLYATDELVVYNTDSPLASGSVEDLLKFLYGWEKAYQYLNVLGAVSDKIVERKRLDYRNKHLAHLIKTGKKAREAV